MSRPRPADLAASVRQGLLNLSVSRGEDPNLTLTRFALEQLLYRLAHSEYSSQFILKGAMLFGLWMASAHRPTAISSSITLNRAASGNPGRVSTFALVLLALAIDDDRHREEKRGKNRERAALAPVPGPECHPSLLRIAAAMQAVCSTGDGREVV